MRKYVRYEGVTEEEFKSLPNQPNISIKPVGYAKGRFFVHISPKNDSNIYTMVFCEISTDANGEAVIIFDTATVSEKVSE